MVERVIAELNKYRTPAHQIDNQQFNKEKVTARVIRTPIVRRISTDQFASIRALPTKEIFLLCDRLLAAKRDEERTVAFDWAYRCRKRFQIRDFARLERWLKQYVEAWGSCDDLCCHPLGHFLYAFPEKVPHLVRWTGSSNRWLRRASAVALIPSLRAGKQLDFALGIADRLLPDEDDLVQIGYGWMLKEATKIFPKQVFTYVLKHKDEMPRTALRYAIEKLPKNMRLQAMKRD